METLWAPWRMDYIGSEQKNDECIFCLNKEHKGADKQRLLLYSDKLILVMMNRYPYNNGHLMIAPRRHIANITLTTNDEKLALMQMASQTIEILNKTMGPEGYNLGINQGKVAGAGIEDHLHLHVTPRYNGDTNYMTTIAASRVIPEHLLNTFDNFVVHYNKL